MSWTRLDDGASIGPRSQHKHYIRSGSTWRVLKFSDVPGAMKPRTIGFPAFLVQAARGAADGSDMGNANMSPLGFLLVFMAVIAILASVSLVRPASITADMQPQLQPASSARNRPLFTLQGSEKSIRVIAGTPDAFYEIVDPQGTVIDRFSSLEEARRAIGFSGNTMLADTPVDEIGE